MDINTFIYGHHHTSESKKDVIGEQEDTLRYIEIGSIGKILSNKNNFLLLQFNKKQKELYL